MIIISIGDFCLSLVLLSRAVYYYVSIDDGSIAETSNASEFPAV